MSEFNNFNINFNEQQSESFSDSVEGDVTQPVYAEQTSGGTNRPYAAPFDPEILKEKENIKNDVRLIGLSFLVLSGLGFLFDVLVVTISLIISRGVSEEAANFLWEPAVLQVRQILFATLSFTVPFIAIFKLAGIRISNLISFKKPDKTTLLPLLMFGVAFCVFANIAANIADSIFSDTNINYEVTTPENPQGFFGFLLSLISTVMVPALAEEFACRGIMLGLLKKHGEGFAILVSSLLFGLMHGNFQQIPFAFLVGLVLGFITIKSGTIWVAVAVHGFNNLVSVLIDYVFAVFPQNVQNIGYIIYLMLALIAGIFAIFIFHKKNIDIYKLEPSTMKCTEKQKMIWFLTSVPIILYVVICLVDSLQYFVF